MTRHNPQAPTAALTLVREGSVRLLPCLPASGSARQAAPGNSSTARAMSAVACPSPQAIMFGGAARQSGNSPERYDGCPHVIACRSALARSGRLRRSGNAGALAVGCRAMIGLWGLPRDRMPWPAAMPPPVREELSPVLGCSGGWGRRHA
jgi:hypothetical protein